MTPRMMARQTSGQFRGQHHDHTRGQIPDRFRTRSRPLPARRVLLAGGAAMKLTTNCGPLFRRIERAAACRPPAAGTAVSPSMARAGVDMRQTWYAPAARLWRQSARRGDTGPVHVPEHGRLCTGAGVMPNRCADVASGLVASLRDHRPEGPRTRGPRADRGAALAVSIGFEHSISPPRPAAIRVRNDEGIGQAGR